MTLHFNFRNVPSARKFVDAPEILKCQGCDEPHIHMFKVQSCECILCAPCWQKSSHTLDGSENKCVKCTTPTTLQCYLDYWKFMAINLMNDKLIGDDYLKALLKTTNIACNIESCTFAAPFDGILVHERGCYRNQTTPKKYRIPRLSKQPPPLKRPIQRNLAQEWALEPVSPALEQKETKQNIDIQYLLTDPSPPLEWFESGKPLTQEQLWPQTPHGRYSKPIQMQKHIAAAKKRKTKLPSLDEPSPKKTSV